MISTTLLTTFITSLLLLPASAAGAYSIVDNYNSSNFFSAFNFFNQADPTQGSVKYLSLPQASQSQIAGFIPHQENAVYLGVDTTTNPASGNRGAVRLESKKSYNHGLFVADIIHMPGGTCASWPAFWLLGTETWPNGGEVDILEGVNTQNGNIATLHTGPGCAMSNDTSAGTGQWLHTDCNVKAPDQPPNVGCAVQDPRKESYGAPFNTAGGGVYAVEWTSDFIKVWFFSRSAIPADLNAGNTPDPTKWGKPVATFQGSAKCSIDKSFKDMQIIINTTLCGSWAGTKETWQQSPECVKQAPTCEEFVQKNPDAFNEAYWAFNSVRVYSSR